MLKTLMLFMLTSCGTQELPKTQYVTSIDLLPLVADFSRDLGRPVVSPVNFASKLEFQQEGADEDTVGLCVFSTIGLNRVLILRSFWDSADETSRWALVFHELGHCELDREHLDTLDDNQCPISLMRWEIISAPFCIEAGLKTTHEYERELFKP